MTRDIAAVRPERFNSGEWGGVAGPKIDDVGRAAIFLDLDGTLADIAETPSAVRIAPDLLETLEALRSLVGGALAIISGRDIEDIDQLVLSLGYRRGRAAGTPARSGRTIAAAPCAGKRR